MTIAFLLFVSWHRLASRPRNLVEKKQSTVTTLPAGPQITEVVPTRRRSHWRRWLAISGINILLPVLLFALAELTLRACGVGTPTGVTRSCTDHGQPGYCDNQFFAAPFFPQGMFRTPRPYVIPAIKPEGTYRSSYWASPLPGAIPILPMDFPDISR